MAEYENNHVVFQLTIFLAHEFHEFTRNIFNELNGDLVGRTNHTNAMLKFVKIRATEQVAFNTQDIDSCKFVKFVGKK